jgi:hypothetical protein
MKVRLTKKLAPVLDGVDVSEYGEGDVIELPEPRANALLAEGWAEQAADDAAVTGVPECVPDLAIPSGFRRPR